jgi:hypothetical protein
MNDKVKNLALQIGGSHYPAVAKNHLPLTIKLITEELSKECQRIIDSGEYDGHQQYAAAACRDAILKYYK